MQVTRTPQALSGGHSSGGVLARVMHQDHREIQLPLQQTEVGQQLGHFPGVVFIHAVQPDQRIQQQQAGAATAGRSPAVADGGAHGPVVARGP